MIDEYVMIFAVIRVNARRPFFSVSIVFFFLQTLDLSSLLIVCLFSERTYGEVVWLVYSMITCLCTDLFPLWALHPRRELPLTTTTHLTVQRYPHFH